MISRELAVKLDLKKYNDGSLCSYGHHSDKYTLSRQCVVCHKFGFDSIQYKYDSHVWEYYFLEMNTTSKTKEESIRKGEDRFWTGKRCKNYHLSPRDSRNGHCLMCTYKWFNPSIKNFREYKRLRNNELIGKQINSWTVVEYLGKSLPKNIDVFKCTCECGNQRTVSKYDLAENRLTICQTCYKEFKKSKSIEKKVGMRHGTFIVTNFHSSDGIATFWEAVCDCGVKDIYNNNYLLSKRDDSVCPHNIPVNSPEDILYNTYKSGALRRNFEFLISKEYFTSIISQKCHYCNSAPRTKLKSGGKILIYNGVDRKDNTHGYTEANCLPCCRFCNGAKWTKSYEDFIIWLDKMAKFNL